MSRPGRERHSCCSSAASGCVYESDLKVDIYSVDEFIQFHKLLKTEFGKPVAQPNQYESGDCVELRAYTNAQAHDNLTSANLQFFPNIEIALRIYLCLMVPIIVLVNARFQNVIKNELRSTML